MNNKEIIKIIFTNPYIDKKGWIFKADINWNKTEVEIDKDDNKYIVWKNGTWNNGTWQDGVWYFGTWFDGIWDNGEWLDGRWQDGNWQNGYWYDGTWHDGTWIKGYIYNPKTGKHEPSTVSPNKCKWSLSYGR